MLRLRSVLFLMILSVAVVWAQTDRGTIRGTITDSSGAVVPNVSVTATNIATGAVTPTTSNGSGVYSIPSLLVGTYRVEADQSGFKKLIREQVDVPLGSVVGLDLTLEIGANSQTIDVTAAPPVLQTETSSLSTNVEPNAYADLPLSAGGGRNASAFVNLVPGVQGTSINGGQTFGNEIQVDGISNGTIELWGDPRNILFPPEFVEELSVLTSSYSAEYGETNSGVIRYGIKSGTNQYHGQIFEYLKNTAFDARGAVNTTTPIDHENEYGFTVGGPVSIPKVYNGKNKTFFFFGADYYRQRGQGSTTTDSLPNAAFRTGDLSQLLTQNNRQIYDPATTRTLADGTVVRDPFPGDIIPAYRISPAALAILKYVPATTTQSIVSNTVLPEQVSQNYLNEYAIKGDHYFNGKHHLTVSETYGNEPDVNPTFLPFPLQEIFLDTNQRVHLARVSYDYLISPTLINQLRLGFNRQQANFDPRDIGDNYPEKLGIPGFQQSSGSFPSIGWGEFNALATNHFAEAPVASDTFVLDDTVSWTKGKHNFKFGMDLRQFRHASYVINQPSINFSSNETANPNNLQNTGDAFASFLLGQVDSASLPLNKADPLVHFQYNEFFVQDDFKVTPKLTLNLGFRGGFMTPYQDSNNEYSIVDLQTPNPAAGNLPGTYVFAGQNGNGSRLSYANSDAIINNPRVGLAWHPLERYVIRAGYGISSVPTGAYGAGHNVALDEGYTATPSISSLNQGITPAFQLDQGFPQSQIVQPPFINPGLDLGQNVSYWSPNSGRVSTSQTWNFTLQTQLMNNLSLQVAYVGEKGTHLAMNTNLNQLNPSYLSLGDLLNKPITDPAVVALGYKPPFPEFVSLYGPGATLGQALRPYPQYLNMNAISSDTVGDSTYNALQISINKRLSNGLYLLANYTYSKNISDSDISIATAGFASLPRDQYNRQLDKVVSSNWVPHQANIAFTYALPVGQGKQFVNSGFASHVIGGWQLGGILTYRTGDLISLGVNNTLPLFAGPQTPNLVLGQPIQIQNGPIVIGANGSTGTKYLNINAFTEPATGTFGTLGVRLPNVFGPAYMEEDMNLEKQIAIVERLHLLMRFEAFNIFNRVRPGGLNTDITNPAAFGTFNGQENAPRTAQITLKLTF